MIYHLSVPVTNRRRKTIGKTPNKLSAGQWMEIREVMSRLKMFTCVVVLLISCVDGRPQRQPFDDEDAFYSVPVAQLKEKQAEKTLKYLSDYGYTASYTEQTMKLSNVIKDFQAFAGLIITGELDSTTQKWMDKTRCGMRDPAKPSQRKGRSGRIRRFNRQGSSWKNYGNITWQYNHRPNARNARENSAIGFTENEVRDLLKKAMALWVERTNINFYEVRDYVPNSGRKEPDIMIYFVSDTHLDDPFPFDGPGGTLAHAFYPLHNKGLAGDVHFDDDERFTIDNKKKDAKDLMWVATHELGHAIGLDHSSVQEAVMYPFYMGYKKDFGLKYDDIIGIQGVYGGKLRTERPGIVTRPPTTPVPAHRVCPEKKMTAIWDYKKDDTYFMMTEGGRLYTVSKHNRGIVDRNINQYDYYNVEGVITAVYQTDMLSSRTTHDVIFTDESYYIYDGFQKVSGPHDYKSNNFNEDTFCKQQNYDDPSPLKLKFPTYGRNGIYKVDAAFRWHRNNKIYFFTGDKYWRYDERSRMFDCGYPRRISGAWRGLPSRIDSAYSSSVTKKTFFTAGDDVYEFDDKNVRVKRYSPHNIKESMLQCEDISVHKMHVRKRRHIQDKIKAIHRRDEAMLKAGRTVSEP